MTGASLERRRNTTEFRDALEARQLPSGVGISPHLGVWTKPSSVRDAAFRAKGWKKIRWREGAQGWLESRFLAVRGQPSHGFVDGRPPHKEVWLLAPWPDTEEEPTKYFRGDLPARDSLRRLVRRAQCRWKIEQDYQQLQEELGPDHYEGRHWAGGHHHVTLVMPAHAFLTVETLRSKETSGWTLPRTRREIQYALFTWTGACAYGGQKIRARGP
jgi:SRSO17 transposase